MLSTGETYESTGLILRLLGTLTLEDDQGHQIKVANRKACGLLAYLALNDKATETRERLAGLLWSDRSEEQARASLRQCLKQLRTIFDEHGFAGFTADRQDISLDRQLARVDIHDIARTLTEGSVPERLLNEGGEPARILYGFETLDQSFAAWLHVIRQNWHDRMVDQLQSLLRTGTAETGKRAADALTKIDPTHEEAHRHLIRHYADDGNTTAALNQYRILWDLLDEEFDMEPDEKTQALIADVKAGSYIVPVTNAQLLPTTSGRRANVSPELFEVQELPVVGICRFVRGGPWNQEDYLIEGFCRELTAALVRFREWIVLESDGSFEENSLVKNRPSVTYKLEGTYFEELGNLQVIITLKDAISSQYIWSEKLALSLEGWMDARQKIIQRLSMAMNVYLSAQRMNLIASHSKISTDLYDRWLRAQQLSFLWRPDARLEAIDILTDIVSEAPDFAPAYCGIVQIKNTQPLVFPGTLRSPEQDARSLALAKTAVLLDPINTRTQLCLAWSQANVGQFEQAALSFILAHELNGSDPWTLASSALGLAYCGETTKATVMADHALSLGFELSPLHWGYQAGVRFIAEDYKICIDSAERSDETLFYLPAWKAAAQAHSGNRQQARRTCEQFVETIRSNWHGVEQPSETAIVEWILNIFPIGREARERLREGLCLAGMPVPG